ncbi:cell wall assembly protein [Myroides albus]|nr:cell wall assembly protein [Myroides albus]UVD81272.1 cell wall assembly protein [Myroides albus]
MNKTMVKEEFTALFKGYKIPNVLKSLIDFQTSENVASYYSNAIYLIDEVDGVIDGFSSEPEFLNSFIPFAEADSVGSIYAFWINNKEEKNLENLPIVVFGGEEGVHVIAQNLTELLQIAAYDVEPNVFEDEVSFPDKEELIEEDEFHPTEFNKEYLDWLRSEAKLKPFVKIEDIDEVVERAAEKLGSSLNDFLKKYNE